MLEEGKAGPPQESKGEEREEELTETVNDGDSEEEELKKFTEESLAEEQTYDDDYGEL